MQIHSLTDIEHVLPELDLVELMSGAFVAYSDKRAFVAPVAELLLECGDVHIKAGYLEGGDSYVVKIASGFYDNPKLGLPSSNGMMLLFDQRTGNPVAVLLDEGRLTDHRTAAAGAVAARYLGNANINRIVIFGTGNQARRQLAHLRTVTSCRNVVIWGRGDTQLENCAKEAMALGFDVETTLDAERAAASGDLIVTTTTSTAPLFPADAVKPGTQVTAVGSDTPVKQELEPELLARADCVAADSLSQCVERGEIFQAVRADAISEHAAVELGDIIAGRAAGRRRAADITIVDLTGVAVQDVEIARAVHEALEVNTKGKDRV